MEDSFFLNVKSMVGHYVNPSLSSHETVPTAATPRALSSVRQTMAIDDDFEFIRLQ
ncbi:hypothetical protein [Asticcacaulis sp. AC402]|uniref:hypothetical protein n=1 Tax=Asticcacaulis sp. AC402 TaxID=1282361 RepID=UPI0003C3EC3B|nr:hypothetical protein [Asticcacaulis sp. AC402]ESQ74298.1 hypothetical protein ABAC402_15135 [Asticcacaulis sp. AC402]